MMGNLQKFNADMIRAARQQMLDHEIADIRISFESHGKNHKN